MVSEPIEKVAGIIRLTMVRTSMNRRPVACAPPAAARPARGTDVAIVLKTGASFG
ncbi:MAG: hypothetical protein Kow0045_05070 [Albidovulum sp.]